VIDIAGSVDGIYISQVLENFSKLIDNNFAIPSQIDVAAGTVQTSNSITPSITFPFTKSITRVGKAVPVAVTPAVTASVAASDGWQQSWTISPITDADSLRNLRALYRNVVVSDANLRIEYHSPSDKTALQQPHCVLCTSAHIPNPKLHGKGWLYWTSDIGTGVPERLPPPGVPTVDLGHWGRHELLMTASAYQGGYLHDFVLFVMGYTPVGSAPSAGGGKGGGGGAAQKRFELIIPQQIQPQMQ
jgi:hypothetical protein